MMSIRARRLKRNSTTDEQLHDLPKLKCVKAAKLNSVEIGLPKKKENTPRIEEGKSFFNLLKIGHVQREGVKTYDEDLFKVCLFLSFFFV